MLEDGFLMLFIGFKHLTGSDMLDNFENEVLKKSLSLLYTSAYMQNDAKSK